MDFHIEQTIKNSNLPVRLALRRLVLKNQELAKVALGSMLNAADEIRMISQGYPEPVDAEDFTRQALVEVGLPAACVDWLIELQNSKIANKYNNIKER